MKRCPECRRDYYDDTLRFCLEDGAELVSGVPADPLSRDEPETAVFAEGAMSDGSRTRPFASSRLPDEPSPNLSALSSRSRQSSRRNRNIAIIIGAFLITSLGVGAFLYYQSLPIKQIESIAVLPFVNETGDPDLEYLSDGMTETLMSSLAKIPELRVKSRSSVFRYKGRDVSPQVVGNELNVQAVLTGRVVARGQNITLYTELVDAATDNVVWKSDYHKPVSDLASLQSDIARDVAGKLRERLSGTEVSQVTKRYTEDPEAYELYLKGRYFAATQVTESGVRQSIEYYEQAIQKDPVYALAYVGLAQSYLRLGHVWGFVPPREAFPRAKPAIDKALELDSNIAEAHAAMGDYKLSFEWNWPEAEYELKRAIELDPNLPAAHGSFGTYYQSITKYDRAEYHRQKTRDLDPLSPLATANVGYPHYYGGDYDQAIVWFRKALELDPNFAWSHLWIGQVLTEKNMHNEAIGEIEKAIAMSRGNIRMKATLGYASARAGDRARAQSIIGELKAASKNSYVSPYFIAVIYSGLDDRDQAVEWLERAFVERHPYLMLLRAEPVFNNIRSDPRFQELVNRVGIPE